jgi:hypothetical protein
MILDLHRQGLSVTAITRRTGRDPVRKLHRPWVGVADLRAPTGRLRVDERRAGRSGPSVHRIRRGPVSAREPVVEPCLSGLADVRGHTLPSGDLHLRLSAADLEAGTLVDAGNSVLWSLTGGSAAFLLGVPQDWALLVSGPASVALLAQDAPAGDVS